MKQKLMGLILCALALTLALSGCKTPADKTTQSTQPDDSQPQSTLVENPLNALLSCSDKSQIMSLLDAHSVDTYQDAEVLLSVEDVKILENIAYLEYTLDGTAVTQLRAFYPLYTAPDAETAGRALTEDELSQVETAFGQLKQQLEAYLGCGLVDRFELVPTREPAPGETVPEDPFDRVYQSWAMREISVRDPDGNVWLLQLMCYPSGASATLSKMIHDPNYENYTVIVDMTD